MILDIPFLNMFSSLHLHIIITFKDLLHKTNTNSKNSNNSGKV